jgi:F-type H+-transporting ATPase subunit alpha
MKKVLGTLKLLYSQYRELQGFAQFGSDLDPDTKARLDQGARIVEVLKQERNSHIDVELQVAIIYAVVNNLLKEIAVADISRYESELFEYLTATKDELLKSIRETGTLSPESESELKEAIIYTKDKFLGKDQ